MPPIAMTTEGKPYGIGILVLFMYRDQVLFAQPLLCRHLEGLQAKTEKQTVYKTLA